MGKAKGAEPGRTTATVRVPKEAKRQLRLLAAAGGENVSDVLERLLRAPLAREFAKVMGAKS